MSRPDPNVMKKDDAEQFNCIVTLHRYFIWANRMRTHFDNELGRKDVDRKSMGMGIEEFMYMSIWYGFLFVVIEGWKELSLSDDEIDSLLESTNVDLLRRYRNGVFHFQREYIDEKLLEFIRDGKHCVTWVRSLNEAFGRFFLTYFRIRREGNSQSD